MGWLKNLFKTKKKINFDEIEYFLSEETKDKKSEIESKVERFRENFINFFNLLIKDFDELACSEFEPVILEDKRDISNIVETSRKNYCLNSKKLLIRALESIKKKESPSEMNSIVLEFFNKLNKLSRDAQILLNPFEKQMKKISDDLKKIKNEIDKFETFLDSDYSIIQKENRAKELIDKIKKNRLNRKLKENKKKEIERQIKELEKEKEVQKSIILKIKNSAEAKKLKNLEKEQILLEKQIENIISETNYLVAMVSRQIRKYLYSNEIDKKEKLKIIDLLENPENLLKGDNKLFEKIIKDTKKNIKKIENDERKRKKFLEIEKNVMDSLNKNVEKYKEIGEKLKENIREIKRHKIDTEKEELKISKLNEQIKELKKDKKQLESEEEFNEKEILKDLEEILSDISGKEIKLI